MGQFIVRLEGKYIVWSTIVDAPVVYGCTLAQLKAYIRIEFGERGLSELDDRLARVEAKGTSAIDDEDADDTMWLNRAGPAEDPLHKEEIIEFYVRRVAHPTAEAVDAFRAARGAFKCDPCVAGPDEHGCGQKCECWGTGVRYPRRA